MKTGFDAVCVGLSVVFSLLFLEGIAGVGARDHIRHAVHRYGDAAFREPIEQPLRFPENDDNQRTRVTQWLPPSEAVFFHLFQTVKIAFKKMLIHQRKKMKIDFFVERACIFFLEVLTCCS